MPRTRPRATFRPCSGPEELRFRRRRLPLQPHPLLNLQLSSDAKLNWREFLGCLPKLSGTPICVRDRAQLVAYRGQLRWGGAPGGTPVHAASFLRRREIVLETCLLGKPRSFRFILVHELFHFVWRRLGNPARRDFTALLLRERLARARGELGESSAFQKEQLPDDDCMNNSPPWRDYVCESFCDTAAWLYSGEPKCASVTLSTRWQLRRAQWFAATFATGCRC